MVLTATNNSMSESLWHQLGKRDAVAETLMLVRLNGERAALREIAEQLLKSDEEHPNPHAKWYLENHPPI